MTRFFIHLSTCILLLLFVLITIMSVSGSTQPTHAALQGFNRYCRQDTFRPCWHGITMQMTSPEEADVILLSLGYRYQSDGSNFDGDFRLYQGETCAMRLYHQFSAVSQIELFTCRNLYLGDVINEFGEPLFFHMNARGHGTLSYLDLPMGVDFSRGLALYAPVDRIVINAYISGVDAFEWYGYVPYWRYCQIHWDNYGCNPL